MVQTVALVTDVEVSGPFVRVSLAAPDLHPALTPGRFVLADLGNYLRKPLFRASLETPPPGNGEFDVLVLPSHPAAALQPGARVDLIGPLGQGFQIPETARRLLLVASIPRLPVLLPLTDQEPGLSTALLLSVSSYRRLKSDGKLYPIQMLPPALEVHIVTADGSIGHRGTILDLFPELVRWADCACIATDPAIYPALAGIVREVRMGSTHHFAQALIVPPMVCGVGACYGCAVPVTGGIKRACIDGPVFDLLELR
jgi:dihydroorotate dehydrogenase electron transfer subunit